MTELKVTTEYSLLKSLIKVPTLMSFLKEHHISACGICDNELFGVMEFYNACLLNDIKPVIGLEILLNNNKCFLYPKNYDGYKRLLKINTLKFQKELTNKDIEDDNIFIILPYESISQIDVFDNKDNIYIGYQNNTEKRNAMLVSENIIPFHNVYALNKDDLKYLKYLEALGEEFTSFENDYYHLDTMKDDENRVLEFIDKINIEMPKGQRYIPVYNQKVDSFSYLLKLAKAGLNKRCNGKVSSKYSERLHEEIDIINKMGFTDYFLIVYDYVLYAKKHNILVGPGRGSAAGSLVSYAIGITDIDPIKYDLLFARFLNPYRQKMPDIDIDFEDTKRMQVISYVKEKYGESNVALGLTFNSLKAKLVLRDLAKVLKIDNNLFEKFIKEIDAHKNLEQNKQSENVKKYLKLYKELNTLYDIAMHLEGLKKNISTHAAGVVISSNPLDEIIPIYDDKEFLKTGIAIEYLENLGLLKMDFLALRNLTIISNIKNKIPDLNLSKIDLEDKEVYKLFASGKTDDIFQFESRYAKNSLLKLKVSSFEELAIAIALVRPGANNQIDEYINNKRKKEFNVHPDLKAILKSTYGVIIFQEQVMKILEVIGGYSPYEADNIRSAISKKKEKIILSEEANFIKRAVSKGYSEKFANNLFGQIKRFAEYGFNKAHAVSYALIAYQIAYLKVHYPVIFNVSLLKDAKDEKTKNRLFNELKTLNIEILKPNIKVSTLDFHYKNNRLLLPFNMIKGLNQNVINEIIKRRKDGFDDIFDFFLKCHDILNDKTYELLVKSGCLDSFGYNKKTLISNLDVLNNYAFLNDASSEKPLLNEQTEYNKAEMRTFESECYGFYVGNHPCSIFQNVIKVNKTKEYLFKNIKMALLVEKVTNIKTKKGENMAFITASDETGQIELTLFPEVLKSSPILNINDIILVSGKSSKRYDQYQIIVNKVERK